VQDALVLSEAAMSQIGGSGPAQTVKNDFLFAPSFNGRVILPPGAIGFMRALRLILSVHKNYWLKRLSRFGVFSAFVRMESAAENRSIRGPPYCFHSRIEHHNFFGEKAPMR
jgi:hypothetical protein